MYSLAELDPRAQRNKKDELSASYSVPQPARADEYALMLPMRDRVGRLYERELRGAQVATQNLSDRTSVIDVGVMPRYDVAVGPSF